MTESSPQEQPTHFVDEAADSPKDSLIHETSELTPFRIVTAKLQAEQIDLTAIQPAARNKLVIVVGNEHARIVKQAIVNFRQREPEKRQPFLAIPGSTAAGLKEYTDKGGFDVCSADNVVRQRAQRFQSTLIVQAMDYRSEFPEVKLARKIWLDLHEKELHDASDAIAALIATYGLRINRALWVRQQASQVRTQSHGRYPKSQWHNY